MPLRAGSSSERRPKREFPEGLRLDYRGVFRPEDTPTIRAMTNAARNRTKRNFAIPAAPAAMPPKPKTAATIATMKNANAQLNMIRTPSRGDGVGAPQGDPGAGGLVMTETRAYLLRGEDARSA